MSATGHRIIASIIMGCVLTLLAQVALPNLMAGKFVIGAVIASVAIFVLNAGIHNQRPSHTD